MTCKMFRKSKLLLLGLALTMIVVPVAQSDLQESEVVILYNSQKAVSQSIRDIYVLLHPGVLEFDLNLWYETGGCVPPACDINSKYITPDKFIELFRDPNSEFRQFTRANPQILAIVTTRGLPAAVSTDFIVSTASYCSPLVGGISSSFEAALSHLGYGEAFPTTCGGSNINRYYDSRVAFDEFLFLDCQDPNGFCPGDVFLVSRLDSRDPGKDNDRNGIINEVDGVYRMLQESNNITVNKYAVNIVFDAAPQPTSPPSIYNFSAAIAPLWDNGWCVMLNDDATFVHGPDDSDFSANDIIYNKYPIFALITEGRNHKNRTGFIPPALIERPDKEYLDYYTTVPGGIALTLESYNGWSLHKFNGYAGHGQILDWIAKSEGAFGCAYVQEPGSQGDRFREHIVLPNFLVNGLSWAESAWSSILWLGLFHTPIGDPLATITVYDPDLSGDRVVDEIDELIVLNSIQNGDTLGDINGDGVTDSDDLDLVYEAWGHDCSVNPLDP